MNGFTHNQPSFDAVVEESLLRGLYLSHLNALVSCIEDPRLSQRHRLVLAQIVQRTNAKTGIAYPGRARLASDIVFYANGEAKHYSERTIGTTIYELLEFGYLVADKRAPERGGRALSHYAITKPSLEELQQKIAEACEVIRNQARRTFSLPNSSDDNPEVVVKGASVMGADDNPGVAVRSPDTPDDNPPVVDNPGVDDNPVGVSDDNPVGATVTGKRTGRTTSAAKDAALKTAASTSRGSRLPADWTLPEEWRAWTHAEFRVSEHQVQLQADYVSGLLARNARPEGHEARLGKDLGQLVPQVIRQIPHPTGPTANRSRRRWGTRGLLRTAPGS
jgi:hypothetical protein